MADILDCVIDLESSSTLLVLHLVLKSMMPASDHALKSALSLPPHTPPAFLPRTLTLAFNLFCSQCFSFTVGLGNVPSMNIQIGGVAIILNITCHNTESETGAAQTGKEVDGRRD